VVILLICIAAMVENVVGAWEQSRSKRGLKRRLKRGPVLDDGMLAEVSCW
jgi:hypothetical protein